MPRFRQNPVMRRELRMYLRSAACIAAAWLYLALLAALVIFAWPEADTLDLTRSPIESRQLISYFFAGQFLLLVVLLPGLAAGSFDEERENGTLELLLTVPLTGWALVWGKLAASLAFLGITALASLPVVVLCIPLGGASLYEVLGMYAAIGSLLVLMGALCIDRSTRSTGVMGARLTSYLLLSLLVLLVAWVYMILQLTDLRVRLMAYFVVCPLLSLSGAYWILRGAARRVIYPEHQLASGEEEEERTAGGLVIERDRFPDVLFVPPPRGELIEDGKNPVFEKEVRAELFANDATIFRRIVQFSCLAALPVMGVCLFVFPEYAHFYTIFVMFFGCMTGAVFTAGRIAGERERKTLELLLTTTLAPGQILWGKLLAPLRVAGMLTLFFTCPLLFTLFLPPRIFRDDLLPLGVFVLLIAMSVLTGTLLGLLTSLYANSGRRALLWSLAALLLLYFGPLVVWGVARSYAPRHTATWLAEQALCLSPPAAVLNVPIEWLRRHSGPSGTWVPHASHRATVCLGLWAGINLAMLAWMHRAFARRWRVGFQTEGDAAGR